MRKKLLGVAVALLVLGGGVATQVVPASGAGHVNIILETELRGKAEAPERGDPNARGTATLFRVDNSGDTICYVLKVSKVEAPTAAHIHKAPPGSAGGVVVPLAEPTDGHSANCVDTGNQALVTDIFTNPGAYYVNVHNARYPGGTARGQLAAI